MRKFLVFSISFCLTVFVVFFAFPHKSSAQVCCEDTCVRCGCSSPGDCCWSCTGGGPIFGECGAYFSYGEALPNCPEPLPTNTPTPTSTPTPTPTSTPAPTATPTPTPTPTPLCDSTLDNTCNAPACPEGERCVDTAPDPPAEWNCVPDIRCLEVQPTSTCGSVDTWGACGDGDEGNCPRNCRCDVIYIGGEAQGECRPDTTCPEDNPEGYLGYYCNRSTAPPQCQPATTADDCLKAGTCYCTSGDCQAYTDCSNLPPIEDDLPFTCTPDGAEINSGVDTAIGCIPYTNINSTVKFTLGWVVRIAGGIALVVLVYAGFLVMTASSDPQKLLAGKNLLIAAVSGLLFIIFSAFILRTINIDILKLPPANLELVPTPLPPPPTPTVTPSP